ncbi:MAG TPA: glutamine--fructose-6-phosphate aminotransferase, partial [Spongiibacteraceae bacterium]|nr:glutamine--fructose-6-phosphate aminotransferase [Spongiibacteraceae bacterium]
MCGLVGAVSQRNVIPSLVDGLRRLEYRGYDSAGIATMGVKGLVNVRALGKVDVLSRQLAEKHISGSIGIGHTRWATHGKPSEVNAHPHISSGEIAVVHNGIIENHEDLRRDLQSKGYKFQSETDTEVIAHLVHHLSRGGNTLQEAVRQTVRQLEGTYGIAVISSREPGKIIAARRGSPLLIGVSEKENYLASDVTALLPVTQYFISLEDGDIAEVLPDSVNIIDEQGMVVIREMKKSQQKSVELDKGPYEHFMQKEIYEQDVVIER